MMTNLFRKWTEGLLLAPTRRLDRKDLLLLCGIFAFAFLLRVLFAIEWSQSPFAIAPHLDAKSYFEWAERIRQGEWFREKAFYQAPFYPYVLGVIFRFITTDPFVVSLLQGLMDALTCVLLTRTSLRLFDRFTALLAGLMASLAHAFIFFTAPFMKETLGLFLFALFIDRIIATLQTNFKVSILLGIDNGRTQSIPMDPQKTTDQRSSVAKKALSTSSVDAALDGSSLNSTVQNSDSTFVERSDDHFLISNLQSFGAGFILGLLTLVRTNALLVTFPSIYFLGRRKMWGFAVGLLLPLLATLAHNYVVSHDWVLVSSTGGFNLFIGHSPEAQGGGEYPMGIPTDPLEEEWTTQNIAERNSGKTLKPSEASKYWSDLAINYALENPLREAELFLSKALRSVNSFEAADNYDQNFIRRNFSWILKLSFVSFGIVGGLALLGAATMIPFRKSTDPQLQKFRQNSKILWTFALFYWISLVIFYVTDRYRLPLYIPLIPLAAVTIPVLLDLKIWKAKRSQLAILFCAVVIIDTTTWTRPTQDEKVMNAYNWSVVATMYSFGNQNEEAIRAFENAIKDDPRLASSQAYIQVAEAHERMGQLPLAEKLFRQAVEFHPSEPLTYHNLGRYLFSQNRRPEALSAFQKSIEIGPQYFQPYAGIVAVEMQNGNREKAKAALEQGLQRNPTSPHLLRLKSQLESMQSR